MKTVIVATKNKGKLKEFENFFSAYNINVKSLLEIDSTIEIEETGSTFEENALIKARTLYNLLGEDVIADDSGLEVPYLNNEPGIYSARYSGEEKNDQANNEKLLQKLTNVPMEKRAARFVCALAYISNDHGEIVQRGTCNGYIGLEPTGDQGFGYDPLFYVPDYNKTFAQLTKNEKQAISHRGDALKKLKAVLFGENNE